MTITEEKIKVLLVDDHTFVRKAFKQILSLEKDLEIIDNEIDTGEKAIEEALKINPDVILLDINLPDIIGTTVLKKIKLNNPKQKVIMLSFHDSPEYVESSLKNGANGYLSKNVQTSMVVDAIKIVHAGGSYIEPTLAGKVMTGSNNSEKNLKVNVYKVELTSREIEILKLLTKGMSNPAIGKVLNISEKTVRNHLYKVFKKIRVNDRTQAAVWAIEHNIN